MHSASQTPNLSAFNCCNCPIQKRAVCAYCDNSELLVLGSMKSYKTYPAGTSIVRAGDPLDFVGSVVQGVASLSQTMEDGRRQMVGLLLPSDFVGRPGRAMAKFDVEATSEVILCQFNRAPFERFLHATPHLHERMLEMALDELDAAREWMLLLGRKTAREKIASLLLIVAKRQNAAPVLDGIGMVKFDLNLTREAMADYLGLTLETVSRQINALKKDGIIQLEKKRQICVNNIDQLRAETGTDFEG
ncbi:transcriptional regulator FnrL [Amylibacter marinus]